MQRDEAKLFATISHYKSHKLHVDQENKLFSEKIT